MHQVPNARYRLTTAGVIAALAIGLTVSGISRAHAAREGLSPDKACSNGTSCLAIIQSGSGAGIDSTSSLGKAVEGHSASGDAVYGETNNPSSTTKHCASGLIGLDQSGDGGTLNYGVSGRSWSGTGVFGLSGSGTGLLGSSKKGAGILARSESQDQPALGLEALGSGPLMIATNVTGAQALKLDQHGNLTIAGILKTSGPCSAGCWQSHDGHGAHIVSYMPRESSPTMEDFGEAQLVNGSIGVRLDPAFASTIDQTKDYLVFLTPDGDTKGLYVAMRSPSGFVVRETGGGRSNVEFSYRIVAKPFGPDEPRLPIERD